MKTNPLQQGVLSENFLGIGHITPEMVQQRAVELAIINGRAPQDVSDSDWDDAKRELTGDPEVDPAAAALEAASEEERWDVIPGTPGHHTPIASDDDEDGRSAGAQLVQEGVSEAEHDQMLQGAQLPNESESRVE